MRCIYFLYFHNLKARKITNIINVSSSKNHWWYKCEIFRKLFLWYSSIAYFYLGELSSLVLQDLRDVIDIPELRSWTLPSFT